MLKPMKVIHLHCRKEVVGFFPHDPWEVFVWSKLLVYFITNHFCKPAVWKYGWKNSYAAESNMRLIGDQVFEANMMKIDLQIHPVG